MAGAPSKAFRAFRAGLAVSISRGSAHVSFNGKDAERIRDKSRRSKKRIRVPRSE